MKKTVHPGSLVREDCISERGLTITAVAEQLGATRQTLSNLTNEKISLTPEMAIRLEKLGWGKAVHGFVCKPITILRKFV